eukprot:m.378465 g.378465  ORF g.378465 m.378465 type:complete len:73 (+) comp16706_c1_seq8:12933-13151(+)
MRMQSGTTSKTSCLTRNVTAGPTPLLQQEGLLKDRHKIGVAPILNRALDEMFALCVDVETRMFSVWCVGVLP